MIKEVVFNKDRVFIDLKNIDLFKKPLMEYFDTVLKNVDNYYPMYEVEDNSTKEDVLKEREKLNKCLEELYADNNEDYIVNLLKDISVKNNGKFRKNSVNKFLIVESATDYSEDYAFWNTFYIQFKAIDENNVTLEFSKSSFHW